MIINVHWSSCKVPIIIVTLNTQISNFMDIPLVAAELFHANECTDTTKLIVAFSNFTKAPKNVN